MSSAAMFLDTTGMKNSDRTILKSVTAASKQAVLEAAYLFVRSFLNIQGRYHLYQLVRPHNW